MDLSVLVAFFGVLVMGIMMSLPGSIKLKLAEVLNIDNARVGKLISTLMLSSLVAVLIIGPLTDMIGYRAIAITGFLLSGICILVVAVARDYKKAVLAFLFLGIGGMCANTVGNVLGPLVLFGGEDPTRASNLLNVFFCLGAFLTPLIVAGLMGKHGFRKTVGLMGAILFIPLIFSMFASYPPPEEGFVITRSLALFGNATVLIGGLSLFCYIALEASMAGFVTTYLKDYDLTDKQAETLLAGFWISLMVARLIAVFTMGQVGDQAVVVPLLAMLAIVSIGIMIASRTPVGGAAGTMLLGLSFGPIFPTVVGVTYIKTDAFSLGITGSVFGVIFAFGLLGGVIVPALIGKYTDHYSIRQSLKIAMIVAAVLVLVSSLLWLAV